MNEREDETREDGRSDRKVIRFAPKKMSIDEWAKERSISGGS